MDSLIATLKYLGYIAGFALIDTLGIDSKAWTALGVLMLVDSALGFMNAWGNEVASSRKLKSGLFAKIATFMIPAIPAYVGYALSIDLAVLVTACLTVLVVSEAYSILSHISSLVSKDKKDGEFDAVSSLLSLIRKTLRTIIEKYLGVDKK